MSKFYRDLTREQVIERLTAQDVRTVMMATDEGDYDFLARIIQGDGFTQYNHMTPSALEAEYGEREDRILELIEDGLMPYDVE
jgi:uncharacterized protein involved in type VI secretion and phage assembly